jgi:hypothetical protein
MRYFARKYILGILTGILLSMVLLPDNILAQPRFYASIDSPEIVAGSFFNLSFVLENAEGKDFKPPPFTGFDQVTGPSRLSSSSFINGVSSIKLSFSYRILINDPGEYTIPAASITAENKLYRTEELKIVVKEPQKIDISSVEPNTRFFIRAEVSNKTPYTGQQILLQYKLYTREKVEALRYEIKPEFRDFKFEEIDMRFPEQRIMINGMEYTVFTISTIALFPLKSGKVIIPPATYRLEIPDRTSGNFFFRSTIPHSVSSERITLEVKELPGNAPEEFSGQAGQFRLSTEISSTDQIVDEAFTLLLTIESDVYPNTITAPNLREKIEGFDIYDAKLTGSHRAFISGRLNSINSFEYVFVPKSEGSKSISIPYTYFDTEKAQYATIWSDTKEIVVKKSGTSTEKTQLSNPDLTLRPSAADLNLRKIRKPFFNSFLYRILLASIISITIILFLAKLRIDNIKKRNKNIIAASKAKKIAVKRLKNAKDLMKQGDKTGFIHELYNILSAYISDKFSMEKSELTSDNINFKLSAAGISSQLIDDYIHIIRNLEEVIYGISDSMDMKDLYEKSADIIYRIEQDF